MRAKTQKHPLNIYVASSWRNETQPAVVEYCRALGHEVYDFRNPPGKTGFSWSAVDPDWRKWRAQEWRAALNHPLARAGFDSDMNALRACEVCLLVLPCGRSAHLELGWAAGFGKFTAIYVPPSAGPQEAELMASMSTLLVNRLELRAWLNAQGKRLARARAQLAQFAESVEIRMSPKEPTPLALIGQPEAK